MHSILDAGRALAATTVGAATQARDAASHVAHAAEDAASQAISPEAKRKAMEGADWAKDKAQEVANQGLEIAQLGAERLTGTTGEFYEFTQLWLKRKLHEKLEEYVDTLPDIIKDSSDDPDMPGLIRRGKNKVIERTWPDIREELLWNVTAAMDGVEESEEDLPPGPDCVRAFMRYHLYPYDKSFWALIKDPVWITFTLVSLIPWAGICPIIFFLIFIIIDKTDEFQLIMFILQFKGTQFVSAGVIKTIVGFFSFIACVTVPGGEGKDHDCDEAGPGVTSSYVVIAIGWLVQIALIWTAFLLLPFSKEKGRQKVKGQINRITDTPKSAKRAGGYLGKLLIYDMIIFLACLAVALWVMSTRPRKFDDYDNWVVQQAFFALQVVYGLLSFPFFFFTLPVVQAILTHSVPTKYDQMGRTRAIIGPPKPEKPQEEQVWKKLLSADEAQKLFGEVKAVILGQKSAKDAAAGM